jgi:hypothetical protein
MKLTKRGEFVVWYVVPIVIGLVIGLALTNFNWY